VKIIADVLAYKENRVREVWGSWEALTDDLTGQLFTRKLITHDDMTGLWLLTGEFRPHPHRHDIITDPRIRISVEDEALEAVRNSVAQAVLELNKVQVARER